MLKWINNMLESICQPGTDGQFCERIFGCRIPLTDNVVPINRNFFSRLDRKSESWMWCLSIQRIIRFHCRDDPEFSRLKSQCLADGNWDLPPRCIIRRSRNKLKARLCYQRTQWHVRRTRVQTVQGSPGGFPESNFRFWESQQGYSRCCCLCSNWIARNFDFLSSLTDNLSCQYSYQILILIDKIFSPEIKCNKKPFQLRMLQSNFLPNRPLRLYDLESGLRLSPAVQGTFRVSESERRFPVQMNFRISKEYSHLILAMRSELNTWV